MIKRKSTFFLVIYLISLIIISGCNKPPEQDIGEAVSKTEDYFKKSKGIDCVGAFDDDTVKFRLLLEEQPTVEEATKIYNDVLKTIEKYSNNEKTWDYYNVKLDIGYKNNIIFKGTKDVGEKLIVKSK
ncbi:hypothetical protein QNH39_18710 [Neobacillus novalis]|uniref:Lipoprotein n=1 Tax=Neobacillus novalis TaxID=220687 RepID=A0AA95MML8_9BACI|nr:hypothetical protein [Neobacillus novalis]WHY84670.1 hypothetical protein QNH39_18710 [Neobacillus novalis]